MQSHYWIIGSMPSHANLLERNIGNSFNQVDFTRLLFINYWASHSQIGTTNLGFVTNMIQQTFASPEKLKTNSAVNVMSNVVTPNIFNTMFLEKVKTKLLKRSKTRITVGTNMIGCRRVKYVLDFGVIGNRDVRNTQTNKLPNIPTKHLRGLPDPVNPVAEAKS